MKITVTGVIDIEAELNRISRKISRQFNLRTGYDAPPVTIRISELKELSVRDRGLLDFLKIDKVRGLSGMEYNDYSFLAGKKRYFGIDAQ